MEYTTPLILDATLFWPLVQAFAHPALYLTAAVVAHYAHRWMPLVYVVLAIIACMGR